MVSYTIICIPDITKITVIFYIYIYNYSYIHIYIHNLDVHRQMDG